MTRGRGAVAALLAATAVLGAWAATGLTAGDRTTLATAGRPNPQHGAAGNGPDGGVQPAAPQRVVSLNLCTDQLAVLLLQPERIAALSFLARDPDLSHVAPQAQELPSVQGLAEEILALKPDLVLAGTFTTRPTVSLLKARGIPVLELGLTASFDDIRAQTRLLAASLGVPERGEALLAEMEAKLARAAAGTVAPSDGQGQPTALTFAPGGFTAGSGTLSDAVMQAAGLANYAARQGLEGYGYLALETLAAAPPDLLIIDSDPGRYPSLAGILLSHPALAGTVPPEARPRVPGTLWTCGGPFTADAVTLLAEARAGLSGARLAAAAGANR